VIAGTTRNNVDELRAELAALGARIERAAAEEDTVSWLELRMRGDALPMLIREARARPLKERLGRLDDELMRLVSERERLMAEEPPEPPASMRGTISKQMMRQRLLDEINGREGRASAERREALNRIAAIEGPAR
jgi:uncharacterized small protein (DUF1192 family)